MNILHISAECFPIAKVGGLADVVGALPKYQNIIGERASVIMPYYNLEFNTKNNFEEIYKDKVELDDESYDFSVLSLLENDLGFDLYLVYIDELLYKDYVYSFDDSDRFLAFSIGVLNWVNTFNNKPDVIHCHDHHTGLIPFMMTQCYKYESLKEIPTVLTIHNAQYQGWFSHDKVSRFPEFDFNNVGLLDWDGVINPLASAIKCAWKVNTVSPSYMEEMKSNAKGLEMLLQHEGEKCLGILNGIDAKVWDPEKDTYLKKNFSFKNIVTGKNTNKKFLCDSFGLDNTKPLFVFIGRLVYEKGADLFPALFEKILAEGNVNILLLGSGEKITERGLEQLKEKFQGNYNCYIGYNEALAHQIYAGADFLLMPSRVEPCGLNQMYAMSYGTIPVVRSIGGLKDTVIDIDKEGYGFVHNEVTVDDIYNAVKRATHFYCNETEFKKVRKTIMQIDHSWDNSANAYVSLYKSLK